jgi:hypothetical protein
MTNKIATALDAAARKLHDTGTRLAGEPGGKVADTISNTVITPIRGRINEPCTCGTTNCGH